MTKYGGLSMALLVARLTFLVGCLEGSVDGCRDDSSCQVGFACEAGSCQPDDLDAGSDAGGEDDCTPVGVERLIAPGLGVGELKVSQQLGDAYTLQFVRDQLGEQGETTSASFALSFLSDALWVTGIDSNGDSSFDASDRVVSLVVRACLNAQTKEGLGVGASRTEVLAQQTFADPEYTATLPAYQDLRGGKLDEYFSTGCVCQL